MIEPKKILLQTTIPTAEDEWSISRFSSLAALLRDARNESGTVRKRRCYGCSKQPPPRLCLSRSELTPVKAQAADRPHFHVCLKGQVEWAHVAIPRVRRKVAR